MRVLIINWKETYSWHTHSNKPREWEPFAYTGFMEKSFQSIPSMTGTVRDVLKFKINQNDFSNWSGVTTCPRVSVLVVEVANCSQPHSERQGRQQHLQWLPMLHCFWSGLNLLSLCFSQVSLLSNNFSSTPDQAVHGDAPAQTCHQPRLLHGGIEVEICWWC